MKILICDDDIKIIDEIREQLNIFSQEQKIMFEIESFSNSTDATKCDTDFDMAFIDIKMPNVDGLALTSLLKEKNRNIIVFIVTSFECYLDDAMDLEVFRYLTKPIDKDRFYRNLQSAINRYRSNIQTVVFNYFNECYSVLTSDIMYITIENKKAVIFSRQKKYLTNQRIGFWKSRLQNIDYIVETHYSYLVNMRYITDFNKTELHLESDCQKITIPISQRKYAQFKKSFFSYIGV